ncbi:hypothetical protein [Fodinibius salsisoli]|uniref:Uncharacterized protein n=1 Tax=Fodinibius salsisoli TaxID=2820877 RepID=A0ABT3PQF5_9BACT|nr:hypothetical protein [Fodinibius salsisoli]MCW9708089.1 hypothetical protein [Fodinibius salsisoli]
MSYTSLSKKRKSIRSTINENKAELSELEVKRDNLFEQLEEVEEQRVNERAKVKVGRGSDKKSKAADKQYTNVKSELEKVRDDIAVSEKAIEMLEDEKAEIESDFQQAARKKWHDKAGKHLSNIHDLMQQVKSEIDTLNGYRKELQADSFHNPSRSFFEGIGHDSMPVISKGKLGADARNFITMNNLKSE